MTLTHYAQLRAYWWNGMDKSILKVRLRPIYALQDYETSRLLAEKMEAARLSVNGH